MINFLKYRKVYFLVSLALLVPSIASLALWRFRPSIDFTGGSLLEVRSVTLSCQPSVISEALGEGAPELVAVQPSGEDCLLRLAPIDEERKGQLIGSLREKFGEVELVRFETVGPTLGRELLTKTLIAVILAIGFILGYVAWQFKSKMYGVCAILAMLHDTVILLGSFSLLGRFFGVEVDTLFVTAVLTTLSLSVHDTVVVFNSIREQVGERRMSVGDFSVVVNQALNATVVRSLNNSFTIIFMLLCLVLLGGETIRWFAAALLVGTVLGTYSSTFIAAPLLTVWQRRAARRG